MPEITPGWSPRLTRFMGPDGLASAWAMALSVHFKRRVLPAEVTAAWRSAGTVVGSESVVGSGSVVDGGLQPALARWRAVPPALRFCPPGIEAPCEELDMAVWLAVGSILERNGAS